MARRKQAFTASVQATPTEITPPQLPEAVPPQPPEAPQLSTEQPAGKPPRQFRQNPFPVKTVNLNGYKMQLQESRTPGQPWQMQIKFGDGSRNDMPPEAILDAVKSHTLKVTTKAGEEKEVQLFRWNDGDRAWGMEINFHAPNTSRQKAATVFDDTVKMVAEDRNIGQQR